MRCFSQVRHGGLLRFGRPRTERMEARVATQSAGPLVAVRASAASAAPAAHDMGFAASGPLAAGVPAGPWAGGGGRWVVFCLLSFFSSSFPMLLSRLVWPEGLSGGVENLFWPATAVHAAGLLRLGTGAWPAILIGTFVSQLCLGRPWLPSLVNAGGNLAETLVFVWALAAAGVRERPLHTRRGVLVFLVAALCAPLASAVPGALTLCLQARLPWANYFEAVAVWSFANATSIVLLAPVLLLAGRERLMPERWSWWVAAWLGGGLFASWVGVQALFYPASNAGLGFLVLPFVLWAALRLGVGVVASALVWVTALFYLVVLLHAEELAPESMAMALRYLQVYGFVIGAGGLLLAALVGERAEAEARLREERARVLESARREERARLEALRYQVEPHFLFNCLNSIRAVSSDVSREMLTELSDYFRSTLATRETDRVPLRDELARARQYLALEQMRHGPALEVECGPVDDAARGLLLPAFSLQPLVENAVRHGFERSREPFRLRIAATRADGRLRVEVANTGRWREGAEPGSGGTGLGLENVRRRLALLAGETASLRVEQEAGWVRVVLELPEAQT